MHSVSNENQISTNKPDNFVIWLEDLAKDNCVKTGSYRFGDSFLLLVGEGENQYSFVGADIVTDGRSHKTFKAGKRHANCLNLSHIPSPKEGSLQVFMPSDNGMFTVYYVSNAGLHIHEFGEADEKIGRIDTASGLRSFSFDVKKGHKYVISTTNKTNDTFYAGFGFVKDEEIETGIQFVNCDANPGDDFHVNITDTKYNGQTVKVYKEMKSIKLLKNHIYRVSSTNGNIKPLVEGNKTFFGSENTLNISLFNVPDVVLRGEITGTSSDNVKRLYFINTINGSRFEASIDGNRYEAIITPGDYQTHVETIDGAVTFDRVLVKAEEELNAEGKEAFVNYNEVFVEPKENPALEMMFISDICVPGDFSSLNEASAAIKRMKNRPEGESGRVTINLTGDIFEQVVMDAPYVTLNGNGHEISWYYGVGTLYYSIDPQTGLYSERLFRDRYSYAEGNGSLWGGVFIVRGENFVARDTIFRNTYNYCITEAEKKDIAGSMLATNRLDDKADVQSYSFKERSNAFYIDADKIQVINCKILSSQDTLGRNGIQNNGYRAYFKDCVIGGNVDYICGEYAAVFDNCELRWKTYTNDDKGNNENVGYICAPKTNPYVFVNCKVTADGNQNNKTVSGYLGRTWGNNSKATFINCEKNKTIKNDGFTEMNKGELSTAAFSEYNAEADIQNIFEEVFGSWRPKLD